MERFTVSEMQEMQTALQEQYKDKWEPICPTVGQNKLLWMIGEIGENVIGFAMGRFETFYDLTAYNLVEIIVASEYQKSGIGTKMMAELEERVKEMGAAMVQLVSVNDEMHEHFYGKLGYGDATNLKLKSKFLVKME